MKKLILFVCVCALFACRGENKSTTVADTPLSTSTTPEPTATTETSANAKLPALTDYKWVLSSAIVTPKMTMNGKTSSDYMALEGEKSCIANEYTLIFLENGIYQKSSSSPSCTMLPNTDDQKWSIAGNKITLTNKYGASNPFIFNGNTITQDADVVNKGVNYKIAYTYKAVKLK